MRYLGSMLPALVVLASTVAVRLVEVQDLPFETQLSLARALVVAIEGRTGHHAVLDDPAWPSCGLTWSCAQQVTARTHASQAIFVRSLLSAELVRVVLKLPEREGSARTAQVDVALHSGDWVATLAQPAIELLGPGPPVQRPTLVDQGPPRSPSVVIPLSLMALGVASGAVGVALGATSQSTQAAFDRELTWGTSVPAVRATKAGQASGASALMLAGGGLLLSGLGWWLLSD